MKIITRKEAIAHGLKRYFTGKPCKHGHVADRYSSTGHCECCAKDGASSRYQSNMASLREASRVYRKENKDKLSNYHKRYYEENKEKIAVDRSNYQQENKEKISTRKREYHKENKEKISTRLRDYYKENKCLWVDYYKNNPLQVFTRCSMQRIEKAIGKDRINKAELELGYTQKEFIQHIESQFADGMSWDDRAAFHIDHIKPLSLFLKEGITDPAIINALSNLQPLWAVDNLSKGAKYKEIA